jgi:hypothetical protein
MFLRTHLPKFAFALLALFLFVSVSDAAECDPCSAASHAGDDDPCVLCPFCLSPCIEPSPVTVSLEDRTQRFAFPEYSTCYEAPFFSFLRPPRS